MQLVLGVPNQVSEQLERPVSHAANLGRAALRTEANSPKSVDGEGEHKSTIIAGRLVGLQHLLAFDPTTALEEVPNWHQRHGVAINYYSGTGCRPNLADIIILCLSSSIANSSSSASITGDSTSSSLQYAMPCGFRVPIISD